MLVVAMFVHVALICVVSKTCTPQKKSLTCLKFRGCVWEVSGRFGGFFGEVVGDMFRTCLGGLGRDFERFLDSCTEDH